MTPTPEPIAAHDARVAEEAWVAGALWALADQGNEITVWLVEAVERRAREENAHA